MRDLETDMGMVLLFGTHYPSLEGLAEAVENCLGVRLALHESSFYGGDYYRPIDGSDRVILQTNNDGGPPEEPAEEDFPDYPILLYVSTHNRQLVVEQMMHCTAHFILLRETPE